MHLSVMQSKFLQSVIMIKDILENWTTIKHEIFFSEIDVTCEVKIHVDNIIFTKDCKMYVWYIDTSLAMALCYWRI